ncbi:MAG: leucine-rich repeat domain-containing protein, partial [Cyanobacteria bacterium P01_H01_bin.35]
MTSSETNWHDYIAQYFQERIQEVKDKKLKELDLGYYGDYFYNENSVKVSYDVVWELEQLIDNTKLYIDYDDRKLVELVEVPGDVWELEQLEVLNLSGNKLTSLPESISKLSNLTRLDLSENQLTSLPESISKLSNLTSLDLSSNQLTSLPESISKLSNLTRLDLSENQLTSLPESISKLSNLTRLDLRNNLLISLPESISQLSNLTRLDLHGNLIQIWLIKIAQQGIEGMRKYFQQTQERIQEAKDKNLKQLDLSNCYFSKDSAKLAEIFGYISELE